MQWINFFLPAKKTVTRFFLLPEVVTLRPLGLSHVLSPTRPQGLFLFSLAGPEPQRGISQSAVEGVLAPENDRVHSRHARAPAALMTCSSINIKQPLHKGTLSLSIFLFILESSTALANPFPLPSAFLRALFPLPTSGKQQEMNKVHSEEKQIQGPDEGNRREMTKWH